MPSPCRGALPWVDPSESKRDDGSWVILDYFCCFMSTDSVSRHYVTHGMSSLFSAPEILVTAPSVPHTRSCPAWNGVLGMHRDMRLSTWPQLRRHCSSASPGEKTVGAIKPLEELGNPLGICWEPLGCVG